MKISGYNGKTYLYLNGISLDQKISLSDHAVLLPAKTFISKYHVDSYTKEPWTYGVMAIFLPFVSSQILVTGDSPKDAAVKAWNTLWDANLLSAIFDCSAVCNLQSDTPAEELELGSLVEATNYHLTGIGRSDPYHLDEDDRIWIENHFHAARNLLDIPEYMTAVSAMASYRIHVNSRVSLAVIWSGIEALFDVSSELVFRLSLYISKILGGENSEDQKVLFEKVKKLYKDRSVAVHGSSTKDNLSKSVEESARILKNLIRYCAEQNSLPEIEKLLF